jgi:CCR4-NOT transcription complex subunit 1
MRNLILSAFPRNMRLPDPFTPNLKVDMLPEINHAPRVLTNIASLIQPVVFKKDLDTYLKARSPVTFVSELRGQLQISNEPGQRYYIKLMNALVLYVGTQAIAHIRSKNLQPNMTTIAHSAHMDIFQSLAVDLDTEGAFMVLCLFFLSIQCSYRFLSRLQNDNSFCCSYIHFQFIFCHFICKY